MQNYRLTHGGDLDRSKPLSFSFDGLDMQGFEGDTLASALLANGVRLVARSFKYHRPRGIMSAGLEESNALVQLEDGAKTSPNRLATEIKLYEGLKAKSQNNWPNLKKDIRAINSLFAPFIPAGFYYKTFMKPQKWWLKVYEPFIRKAAGLGISPLQPDSDSYESQNAHCDILIVGAGPAGLSAALTAGKSGARVIILELDDFLGGSLRGSTGQKINNKNAKTWLNEISAEVLELPNVQVLTKTMGFGYYDHNFITAVEYLHGSCAEKLWRIRAKRVILATGSIERPLVFADNDRPGIMLAGALQTYINRFAVLPGKKIVLFTNNDSAYRVALYAHHAGASVSIVDLRPDPQGSLVNIVKLAGIMIYRGSGIVQVKGKHAVSSVRIAKLSDDCKSIVKLGSYLPCDLVGMSGGWSPSVQLHMQGRGKLKWDSVRALFQPSTVSTSEPHYCVGSANGTNSLQSVLNEGASFGKKAVIELGFEDVKLINSTSDPQDDLQTMLPVWRVPVLKGKRFHEFQNDSTAEDLTLAVREGLRSIEHVKRYTTTGMATDQGKTSNLNGLGILSEELGREIPEVGTTTFRPPYHLVSFGVLANTRVGELFAPERKTPMHSWHENWGAPLEPVGDWLRPWWFPKDGEDQHAAVERECLAVRTAVGMGDASTLGKIDIRGKDAAEFLNRVYTNAWSKLKIGSCRYGLMLNEQGFVFDDGVTTRLAEDHFHMTTTSGGAGNVMTWMEDWAQTEWQDLDVYFTSVTEQWAVVQLSGPKARDLLSRVTDMDLSNEAFPFMTMREGEVAGVSARVCRISFTGELSFEINVPSRYGLYVWEQLYEAGQTLGVTPYGNETMHVLRAEKGFIIVGQDTDGTVTPMDLQMHWIIGNKKPDFLGKRSFERPAIKNSVRKELVGFETSDPNFILPDGVHLTRDAVIQRPIETEGHVTSSYWSPTLKRSIAMGLLKNGSQMLGNTFYAHTLDGRVEPVKVVETVLYDKEGGRVRA